MKRILIYSIFPAPYRVKVINEVCSIFEANVCFEYQCGDDRNKEWFDKSDYPYLDTKEGFRFFKNALKNIKLFDLVLVFDFSTLSAIKLIRKCKIAKVPYIINCDGVMLFDHGNFLKDIIKRFLIKDAAGYLASGEYAKQYFLKYGAKEEKIFIHNFTALHKIDILKNVLSMEEKVEIRKKLNLPVGCKICIAVGRYIPLKRYDKLINLWKEMTASNVLLLLGGGPEKEKYDKLIKDEKIQNVIILDFCPFNELLEYYKASDLFVHPTSYDVWGLVINEAMACGLPVVTTDKCVAGLELVENGKNGYVVPVDNLSDFMKSIKEILKDDSLSFSMSQNNLRKISSFYMENMAMQQIESIKKILG